MHIYMTYIFYFHTLKLIYLTFIVLILYFKNKQANIISLYLPIKKKRNTLFIQINNY